MMLTFPPFRIDLDEERLWKGTTQLALRRKPFAILRYLVTNPKRLVTHEELLEHVWRGTAVSESAVRSHLHELRHVLGEGVIETVIGRGYRFAAELSQEQVARGAFDPSEPPARLVVGRASELETLRAAFTRAESGRRQLCFVTGDPGIGKTTLVDAFLDELQARQVLAVRGQCIEQHGTPESYLAVIEILGALRRSSRGEAVASTLVRYAPTFAAQVPHLIPDSQIEEVTRRSRGGTEAKMVRELIEALEVLTTQQPLVIVLEDLQWSDIATIDLLSYLGQRKELARLLVIGTSRRAEASNVAHPLNRVMRSLVTRGGATAIVLDRVELQDVRELIDRRFPGHTFPVEMIATVAKITGGTPLFMVSLLDDMVDRGMLAEKAGRWSLEVSTAEVAAHRPDSVTQLIDIQLDRLGVDEQRLLEAGSAIGLGFSSTLVAAALEQPVEEIDERCEQLVRLALFVRRDGTEEWPDGTVHSRYAMTHGLVQEVCNGRSAPARRQRWHRLVADRLEAAYGERASEISHVLATHLDKSSLPMRAIHYYSIAALRTAQRFASSDAHALFRRALDLLARVPESRERDVLELGLLQGTSSSVLRQNEASREPLELFERMIVIARRIGDQESLCASLLNLSVRYSTLAEYAKALAVIEEVSSLGLEIPGDSALRAFHDSASALPLFWTGKLAASFEHLEVHTLPHPHTANGVQFGILGPTDRRIIFIVYLSVLCCMLGEPERAFREAHRAIAMADASGDPYTRGLAGCNLSRLGFFIGEPTSAVREAAQAVLAIPDCEVWYAQARMLVGWADSEDAPLAAEAIEELLRDFRARSIVFPMGTTFLGLTIVGVLRNSGRDEEAGALVEEMITFVRAQGERLFEPEFLRMRADLVAASDGDAAERGYMESWECARAMGSRSLELRAALRLAMLRPADPGALDRVAEAAGMFKDGRDTADLVAARELLATRSP